MRWLVLGALSAALAFSPAAPATGSRDTDAPASSPSDLLRLGDVVFFRADDGSQGAELWMSDGTVEGTALVKDILPGPGGGFPAALTRVGAELYFAANDGAHGQELWKSDGTEAGTVMVKDITPGAGLTSLAAPFHAVGSELFFAVQTPAGQSLWKSGGTEGGTVEVKPIGRAMGPGAVVGSTLFFFALDDSQGWELWTSDGTPDGTSRVENLNPGPEDGVAPFELLAWGGEVYFGGDDGAHGVEPWRSDGTAAGTRMVKDVNPGGGNSNSWPGALESLGGRLLFSADDGAHGPELWKTDGTRAGTLMIKDLTPAGRRRSRIGATIRLGNLALFTAFGEQTLHRTDGTAKGTKSVWRPRDGGPGAIFGPGMTRAAGIGVLFEGFSTLWKSNGWRNGTVELLGFRPAEITALAPGRALFAVDDGVHGEELWITDGTPGGTLLVEDINP